MAKRVKIHTLELTENELARVLFVMRAVNGNVYGGKFTTFASEKLGVKEIAFAELQPKWEALAKIASLPRFINYYSIQKEWESFLGVVSGDQATLDKIAKLERELAELKESL